MLAIVVRKFFRLVSPRYGIVPVRKRRVGVLGGSKKVYQTHKEIARALIKQKLSKFNAHYQFSYRKVAVKNQRSRWGSCSKQGNLNFNYRIAFLPQALQDYIIVHELCHLSVFNHSKKFWALVAETVPDHLARRKELVAYRQKQGAVKGVTSDLESAIELT